MNSTDDDVISRLGEACTDAAGQDFESVVSVASLLRRTVSGEDDPVKAVIAGLEYHYVSDGERRDGWGPYGPMIEGNGSAYPAPVGQIDEIRPGTHQLWQQVATAAPLALVRARFHDLLWEARAGDRPFEHALAAIDEYIVAIDDGFGHDVELSEAIRRAVELASSVNDSGRREGAIRAAVTLASRSLASTDRKPGVVLPLIEMFIDDRDERRPPELQELLDRAVELYGDDPWNLESMIDLQARLVGSEQRAALHARSVEAFRDLARGTAARRGDI